MASQRMAPEKFHYVPNGIDLGSRSGAVRPRGCSQRRRDRHIQVGFVGTLGHANVLERLIDAARLLEQGETRVIVVGHGSERDALRRGRPAPRT